MRQVVSGRRQDGILVPEGPQLTETSLNSGDVRFDCVDIVRFDAAMKRLTDIEVARDFDEVLAYLESTQEEVAVMRNDRIIARIVPEPAEQDALEVFGDLYRTLDDETADDLEEAMRRGSCSRRDSIE